MQEWELAKLPNSQRLVPTKADPMHDLYDGRLLEPGGVVSKSGEAMQLLVCDARLSELKEKRERPPTLSLANGLWVGCRRC